MSKCSILLLYIKQELRLDQTGCPGVPLTLETMNTLTRI